MPAMVPNSPPPPPEPPIMLQFGPPCAGPGVPFWIGRGPCVMPPPPPRSGCCAANGVVAISSAAINAVLILDFLQVCRFVMEPLVLQPLGREAPRSERPHDRLRHVAVEG